MSTFSNKKGYDTIVFENNNKEEYYVVRKAVD